MVLGNRSKFTEGFTSFTADDDLMLANLKQALNYSKESVAIPDPSINITNPATTKPNMASMNTIMGRKNNNLPSTISDMGSGMPTNTKMAMDSVIPSQTMPTNIEMGMGDGMPSTTPSFTMSTQGMPSNDKMGMGTGMNNKITTTSPQMTMSITTKPNTTKPSGMSNSSMSGFKNVDKFSNINRVMNNGDEDEESDEEAILEEEDDTNEFEEEAKETEKQRSATRRQSDKVEGFRGSMEIESKQMRNILLALLLSCIGYLIVYSMGNNLLPLDDISPQLKKFKGLIYAGLFFLIAYICLEVF